MAHEATEYGSCERTHLRETSAYDAQRALYHGYENKGCFHIGDVEVMCVQS